MSKNAVKTNAELAEHVMQPVLAAAGRRLLQTLDEIDKTRIAPLETALRAIIAKPHGCIYCDYGELRRPPKFPHARPDRTHDDDCGYAMAEKLLKPKRGCLMRTSKQKEADRLDLMVFRTVSALLQFADDFKDRDVREMALDLAGSRYRLRKHMHRNDAKATAA